MSTYTISHVYAHTLQIFGREATDYARSLLHDITTSTRSRSFLFHDAEDGQTIALAQHWLTFAGACAQVVADLAEQGGDAIDEATVALISDSDAKSITLTSPSPEHGPGWTIRYPADADVLGIDIAALIRDNL
jgi:hypothetical protein